MQAFPISDGMSGPEDRCSHRKLDERVMIAERTGDADGSQAKRFPASDTRDSANRRGAFNAVAPTSFPQVHRPNERTGFGPGTMIMTRDGEIAVEWLDTSHHVLTRDNGFQPILWIGRRTLSQTDLIGSPDDLPVRFPAGCLGPDCPAKDLEITADLRLLIADPLAEMLHASHEVLAPAKSWPCPMYSRKSSAPGTKSFWGRVSGSRACAQRPQPCASCFRKIARRCRAGPCPSRQLRGLVFQGGKRSF